MKPPFGDRLKPGKAVRFGGATFLVFLLASGVGVSQTKAGPRVNQDAGISADFEKRVNDYMKIHQTAQSGLTVPKHTNSPTELSQYQQQFADRIRSGRLPAQQGDIFTPEIADLFRRLVSQSISGPQGTQIRKSYERAEPIRGVHLAVNQTYPDGLPLQSMPPSLLLNLPKLPKELEYRFVDHELVLRDIPANLIVDLIPSLATPSTK